MANTIQVGFSSKVGVFLHHLLTSNVQDVGAEEAARVMGISRRNVSAMLAYGVRSQYLTMIWEADGQHYKIADDVVIQKGSGPWYEVFVPMPEGFDAEIDFDIEFLKIRRSWVDAKDVPPPHTTGVRSVFDLAGSLL